MRRHLEPFAVELMMFDVDVSIFMIEPFDSYRKCGLLYTSLEPLAIWYMHVNPLLCQALRMYAAGM